MRNLVILRGCPGAGKSTWIKENGLEPYTLSPDNIRTMVCAPVLTEKSTELTISQENETYVWSLLYELLEKRMKNGDFTIIDATHSRSTDFSRYNSLCSTYRYRKYVVSFTDVPKEVCIERNHQRDAYKRVPDEVIEKMYARFATQEKTSGWVDVPRDKFWEVFSNKLFDFNDYKRIHIFGDIHGCFDPLKEYIVSKSHTEMQDDINSSNLKNFLNDEDFYLFTGDYLDRGIQNKEVLEFMISIMDNKNVLMLEGNHERYLWYWSNEQDAEIKNREFMYKTVPQIKGIDTTQMRQFYRKLGQMAYFTFNNQEYFITHAGLNTFPKYIQLVSTSQFIRGVGAFRFPVDDAFTSNTRDLSVMQVHGHRSLEPDPEIDEENNVIPELPYSFSLEDRVEFGGNFKVMEINEKGNYFHTIKNNTFREETEEEHLEVIRRQDLNINNIVERLRSNKNVRESELGDNISSFNFTSKAFEKGRWNSETVKARGLFIDTEKNKIVARGYEKFFNINEQETCKLFNLKRLFDEDETVVAYKKYNGFLGILSYYNDSIQFHSKSTNAGEYAGYFRKLFFKQYDKQQIAMITEYLMSNDVSITFEVIDLENDPHIIDEKKSRVVLLDIIHNKVDFEKEPYEKVVELAKSWKLSEDEYKQIYTTFDSYRQLTEFYEKHKDEDNLTDTDIEGVVIECGSFMTKLKFSYYTFWKFMRSISQTVMGGRNIELRKLYNATSNYFYKFLKDKYEDKFNKQQELLAEIGVEELTVSDLNRAQLTEDSIIKVRNMRTEEGYLQTTENICVGEDIIQRIKDLRENQDIISLRNEYYANGGV